MAKIVLCGGKKCCPTIEKTEDEYIIRDDYGGKVRLEKENIEKLKEIDL